MPLKERFSDDYVAELLAKDAESSTGKYSSYGLQALLPKRSTNDAPKPNTRFLKNIIKETDSHNAALRAKEAQESRARLRELRKSSGTSLSSRHDNGRLSCESLHLSKRRRIDEQDEDRGECFTSSRPSRGTTEEAGKSYKDSNYDCEKGTDTDSRLSEHRHHHHRSHHRSSHKRSKERQASDTWKEYPKTSGRLISRSPRLERESHRDRSHRRRPSSSILPRPSGVTRDEGRALRHNASPETSNGTANGRTKRAPSLGSGSDSDPLLSIIGPPPPPPIPKVQARGRGAFASGTTMDTHFSSHYDPSVDVQPNPESEDDWDQALEALRDRQRWQKQGAERLKSAGYTEEEVKNFERGREKSEGILKWRGRGEDREWDKGKVDGMEHAEGGAEWGRLKGT